MKIEKEYLGYNFIWFFGVVEDRKDPLKLGRVRVRAYSWHTESLEETPTESLPWAIPLQNITSAAMGDIGRTPTGMVEGTWVVGFFMDGKKGQQPMVMGTVAGIPQALADPTKGFNDPNGIYPMRTDEPDTNRLGRNDDGLADPEIEERDTTYTASVPVANLKQIVQSATSATVDAQTPWIDNIATNVDMTVSGWDEPRTTDPSIRGKLAAGTNPETGEERVAPYNRRNTEYPYNHVFESESGHIKEYDDTPYAERIYEKHRTGTFYEIDADGNRVTRIVGQDYEVVAGNKFVNIKGDCNITIDANCKTYIKGDWNIQVDGDVNEVVNGNVTRRVVKNQVELIVGNHTESVDGNVTENYGGNQSTQVTGNIDIDGARIDLN